MAESSAKTQTLGGIEVPDTPAIKTAIEYARTHLGDLEYNHVMRSFLFGFCIGSKLPHLQHRDLEVHAVASILHDLGWSKTEQLISKDKRFEVDGAIAARNLLDKEAEGWDARRKQLVWDAIALHTTPSIAQHKEPEVVACHLGIFADFMGPDMLPGVLTWEEYESIVKEFPRLKFVLGVRNIMCGLCKTKPETTYDNFVSGYGEKFVDGYSLEGKKAVDMLESSTLPDSF